MIYNKLLEVQNKVHVGKDLKNNFGGFKYRNAEMILEAAKPILKEIGALIVLTDSLEYIGDRYYIKATATFVDIDDGSKIETSAYAREEKDRKGMDASQITGSCSSYARKYALCGLLNIDDGKDADSMPAPIRGDETPLDSELVNSLNEQDIEELKNGIRGQVEKMAAKDPSLQDYQDILYTVIGEDYTSFKVGACKEDKKNVLVEILARLIKKSK